MDPYAIENAFTYHAPHGDQLPKYQVIRTGALNFALTLRGLCPDCSELERALDKVDEAVMLANAAIARHS